MIGNQPPIEESALDWLEENIKPEMSVFEYGSGSSTLFFGRRVDEVTSVECYPEKYEQYKDILKKKINNYNSGCRTFSYTLIKPEENEKPFPYSHESYGSIDEEFADFHFKRFVNSIKEYRNHYFDIVLINARSRSSCIRTAVPKVKKGGLIILNDSERYEYQDAIEQFLKKYPHQEFGEDIRKTSIWTIDD